MIFENHITKTKAFIKKFGTLFSQTEKMNPRQKWLDKFAFVEIGTLLDDSPKTILIKFKLIVLSMRVGISLLHLSKMQ